MQTPCIARRFTLALVCVIAMAAGSASAEEAASRIDLRPHFVQGRSSRYSLWTLRRQDVTIALAGRTQSASTQMIIEGEVSWKVLSVAGDGSAVCTMTIDWLTFDLTTTDGKHQFNDSRQGTGDTEKVHNLMRAMAGVPVTVHAAADGSITRVEGVEAMRGRAAEGVKVPDDLDFVESASDLATLPYAPAEIAQGGTFNAKFGWSHEMGIMNHDSVFTVSSVEQVAGIGVATVDGHSRLTFQPDFSKLPPDAPKMSVELKSGEATTQTMFDLDRHEAVGRNSRQNTTIQITMDLPNQNQTLVRTLTESVQGQVLRISEE